MRIKDKTPSFGGITSKLAKNMYTRNEIISMYEQELQRTKGIVGTLPPTWISKIPFDQRRTGVKEILDSFSFPPKNKYLSPLTTKYELLEIFKPVLMALQKYKVINSSKDFLVDFLGSGAYGDVFCLSVNKEKFAFKNFYTFLENGSADGNFVEQAAALFINKHFPNKNWAKFYFGDMTNSTLLTRLSSNDNKYLKNKADIKKLGLIEDIDHISPRNIKGGRIVDFGRIEFNPVAARKNSRYIFRAIYDSPECCSKLLKKAASSPEKNQEYLEGFIYSLHMPDLKDRIKIVRHVLENINEKTGVLLASRICDIPHQIRTKVFKALLELDSDKIDCALSEKIEYFEHKLNVSKLLASKNKVEVDQGLIANIGKLHADDRVKMFDIFLQKNNPELIPSLDKAISVLPLKSRESRKLT